MDIFKRVGKGLKALADEVSKPESFARGEEFEEYVRKFVFPKGKYELIHVTHAYEKNRNDYVKSSLHPDFKFRCIETDREFFVEVKFRKGTYYKNKIEWCKQYQLKRYKEIDKNEAKVFLCLGLGDDPSLPDEVFIIPLSKLDFTSLFDSFLDKYSFYLEKPVFPKYLWNLDKKK